MLFVNLVMTRTANNLDVFGRVGFLMPFPTELLEGNNVMEIDFFSGGFPSAYLALIARFLLVSLSKLRIARAIVGQCATLPFGRLISLWTWLAGFAREKNGIEEFGPTTLAAEVVVRPFHSAWPLPDNFAAMSANGFDLIYPSGMIAGLAAIFALASRFGAARVVERALKGGAAMSAF